MIKFSKKRKIFFLTPIFALIKINQKILQTPLQKKAHHSLHTLVKDATLELSLFIEKSRCFLLSIKPRLVSQMHEIYIYICIIFIAITFFPFISYLNSQTVSSSLRSWIYITHSALASRLLIHQKL